MSSSHSRPTLPSSACSTVVRQVKGAMSNTEDLVGLLTDARASRDWAVCDVKYRQPQLHFSFKVSIHESFSFFFGSLDPTKTSFHWVNFYN